MSSTKRRRARRTTVAALTAVATAAGGAALLGPSTSQASSHREAPYTQGDPSIDNTDTYAFVSPDRPDTVTLVANWSPFQEPSGGPNFFPWDTSAAYDINVDNDGDAQPDLTYRWTFNDVDTRGTAERGAADGTFLYNEGPVTSLTDPDLKYRQTYDLTVIAEGVAPVVVLDDAPVVPNNVGTASTPNYAALRAAAVKDVAGGSKSYVGQADDAFFLDLRVFDLLYGGNLKSVGYDSLSGYNVNTIAFQVPKSVVAAAGNPTANPVIGVWSTTSRKKNRVLLDNNAAPGTSPTDSSDTAVDSGEYVQVSRLGSPLVNEAVVPANLKDYFNRSTPADHDAAFLPKVQNPEVPVLLNQIYGVPNPADTASGAGRPDLVAAFITGFSKDQAAAGPAKGSLSVDLNSLDLNAVSPTITPAEYLRLNMAIPPTTNPNPRGVIAGDNAGFPNGRRLGDDVVDIELQVLAGIINADTPATVKAWAAGLGDAVYGNDRPFLATFPYVADPHSGGVPRVGQTQEQFHQYFTSQNGKLRAALTGIGYAVPGGRAQLIQRVSGVERILADQPLDATGRSTAPKVLTFRPGTNVTLYWKVIPPIVSAFGAQPGLATTVTVR